MKTFIIAAVLLATTSVANAKGLFTAEERPEEWCMAQNIYYEARGSNRADRIAVADVVLNRVKDTRYPNTICEVVKQGKQHADGRMKRNACQFSWYCDGKSDWPRDMDAWVDAQQIAYNMIQWSDGRGLTEGATHYHAKYVSPEWAKDFDLIGRIGDPFMRRRRSESDRKQRPEYQGMGLGLFIAKTLLERTGAELTFANGASKPLPHPTERRGAIVNVTWPREKIDALVGENAVPKGENKWIEV